MIKLGLDFGTTNSSITIYNEDGVLVRETSHMDGEVLQPIPSLVAVRMDQWKHGLEALVAGLDNTGEFSVIRQLKPKLGKSTTIAIDMREYNIADATKRYLRHLLDEAGVGEGVPFDIVVGTPVRYPREHRVVLRQVLRDLGANSVLFVYEPTAGLHYALSQDQECGSGPVLVVDWGGGTVDVTISTVDRSSKRIIDHDVSARMEGLGGGDLDKRLLVALRRDHIVADWIDTQSRAEQTRLLLAIERAKIRMLERSAPTEIKLNVVAPEDIRVRLVLSRQSVEDAALDMVIEVIALCRKALDDSNLLLEDLSGCLLIGGLFQSMTMLDLFREQLGTVRPLAIDNRQLSTSRGCGLLAVQGFSLALAGTLEVGEADGSFLPLIDMDQKFPVTAGPISPSKYIFECENLQDDMAQFVFFMRNHDRGRNRKRVGELTAVVQSRVRARAKSLQAKGTDVEYDADVVLWVGLDSMLYFTAEACGIRKHAGSDGKFPVEMPRSIAHLDKLAMQLVYGHGSPT